MTVLLVVLAVIAGIGKAAMDTIQFHFDDSLFDSRGMNKFFWDPYFSWRNKYKNGYPENGPKFFLSTTVLVFLTDGWHLMQFITWNSIFAIIGILFGWEGFLVFIGVVGAFKAGFYVFYNFILKKN